jgi:TatD DNase family protein
MYIDAHAHFDKYDSQLPQAIKEIEQHEIFTISVSMDPEGYAKSKAIDKQTKWILSTFGVHPWNAPTFHSQLEALQPLIDASPMIGEIGLDYHFIPEPENHALQRDVFLHFVKQGICQKKILNIHSKGAEADVDRILGELGGVGQLSIGTRERSSNCTLWPKRACISRLAWRSSSALRSKRSPNQSHRLCY